MFNFEQRQKAIDILAKNDYCRVLNDQYKMTNLFRSGFVGYASMTDQILLEHLKNIMQLNYEAKMLVDTFVDGILLK